MLFNLCNPGNGVHTKRNIVAPRYNIVLKSNKSLEKKKKRHCTHVNEVASLLWDELSGTDEVSSDQCVWLSFSGEKASHNGNL